MKNKHNVLLALLATWFLAACDGAPKAIKSASASRAPASVDETSYIDLSQLDPDYEIRFGKYRPRVQAISGVVVNSGQSVDITLLGSDPQNDPLTYQINAMPINGKVSISGNKATYTANMGFSGSDSFKYSASDGTYVSTSALVTITVSAAPQAPPPNNLPIAQNVSASTPAGVAVVITLVATDADGDALSYAISSAPLSGSMVSISANKATYTPKAGFSGADSFKYVANDGKGNSLPATVSVSVAAAPQTVPSLSLNGVSSVQSGNPMKVTVNGPSGGLNTQWVALYVASAPDSAYSACPACWQYVFPIASDTLANQQMPGVVGSLPKDMIFNTSGLAAGTYNFRYFKQNDYQTGGVSNLLAKSADFTVTAAPVTIGKATLSWDANLASDNVTSYNVYRGTSQASLVKIGSAPSPSYIDATPNKGTTYYYAVTAINSVGESDKSSVIPFLVP
jgi:hypothetical protein